MTVTILLPPTPSPVPAFDADGERVVPVGEGLRTNASVLDDHATFVHSKAKDSGLLDGEAAGAYANAIKPIGQRADAMSLALRDASNHIMAHGEELIDLDRRHRRLNEDREQLIREIAAIKARGNPMPTDPTELEQLAGDCDRSTEHVNLFEEDLRRWTSDVEDAEDRLIRALRNAMSEQQVEKNYAGQRDPADVAKQSMPSRKDPKAISAWWSSLTDEQREAMAVAYPEVVGNTDGIPATARSIANTIALDRDLAEIGAIPKDDRTADEQTRYENARAADQAREMIAESEDPVTGEFYNAQIYMYDPMAFDGDGAVAMSVGDLDTADDVSVNVPGLTTDMQSSKTNAQNAINLQQAASWEGGVSTATMFWIGYDAPSGSDSGGVATEAMAEAGGARLANTLDGLNAMRNDDFHLTAIGHSYGSTTVAHGMTDHDPAADDVALLGSPGAGDAETAEDLGVGKGHVFVGTNSNDPVGKLGGAGWLDPAELGKSVLGPVGPLAGLLGNGMGHNPADEDFGGIRFEAESTSRGQGPPTNDHVKYYDHGSESLHNLARIVNGEYSPRQGGIDAPVDRADPVEDPMWRPPDDPEAERAPTAPETGGKTEEHDG